MKLQDVEVAHRLAIGTLVHLDRLRKSRPVK